MHKNTETDLGSRGQTKDPNQGRCLSRLYNKRNGLKTELI